jgi:DNA-binding CsgD family transcriptional regulator
MHRAHDPIELVEAAYDLSSDDETWLAKLLKHAAQGLDAPWVIAAMAEVDGRRLRVDACASVGVAGDVRGAAEFFTTPADEAFELLARFWPRAASVDDVIAMGLMNDAVAQIYRDGSARIAEELGAPPFRNSFIVRGCDMTVQRGLMLVAPWPHEGETPRRKLDHWRHVASHLSAALRLRTRIRTHDHGSLSDAIFEADGRCVHAERDAAQDAAQERLRDAVRRMERARGEMDRGAGHTALESWTALVDGRWSLVDRFEADGRRYIVAKPNDAGVRDPRALTKMESAVALLVARALSNKEIAYELGLATSTVAEHASSVARKLGVGSRPELVREIRSWLSAAS